MYSVFDVTEEVVDPFSQSFSPFLLLERLGDRKPSAESGLENTHAHRALVYLSGCVLILNTQHSILQALLFSSVWSSKERTWFGF